MPGEFDSYRALLLSISEHVIRHLYASFGTMGSVTAFASPRSPLPDTCAVP